MSYQLTYRMPRGTDIAAFSRDWQLELVVQVTGGRDVTPTEAAQFRKDLLENDLTPNTPFWLVVTERQLLLWRRETGWDGPPDFTASTQRLSQGRLADELAEWSGYIRRQVLGRAVWHWLQELADGIREADPTSDADQILSGSGLLERIKRGGVDMEMPRDRHG
jgi:hypothetical protein